MELHLPAYAIATALPDLRHMHDLHHSSRQHQILNPVIEPRDGIFILMDPSRGITTEPLGNSHFYFFNKRNNSEIVLQLFLFIYLFIYLFFAISWAAPAAHGGSQARGPIGAVATGLRQSHSNVRSEPHLWPTPQLTATPDPQPTEQGHGSNLQPHGS